MIQNKKTKLKVQNVRDGISPELPPTAVKYSCPQPVSSVSCVASGLDLELGDQGTAF